MTSTTVITKLKWHFSVNMTSTTGSLFRMDMISTTVITKLKWHFSVHGYPHLLLSDNGAQYMSQRFKNIASTWDFVHRTSSPEFQQSNGLAEKAVSSTKKLLEKSRSDGTDAFQNLLNIRNIPRGATLG